MWKPFDDIWAKRLPKGDGRSAVGAVGLAARCGEIQAALADEGGREFTARHLILCRWCGTSKGGVGEPGPASLKLTTGVENGLAEAHLYYI